MGVADKLTTGNKLPTSPFRLTKERKLVLGPKKVGESALSVHLLPFDCTTNAPALEVAVILLACHSPLTGSPF